MSRHAKKGSMALQRSGPGHDNGEPLRLKVKLGIDKNSPLTVIMAEPEWSLYDLKERIANYISETDEKDVDTEQIKLITKGQLLENDEATLEMLGVQGKYHIISVVSRHKKGKNAPASPRLPLREQPKPPPPNRPPDQLRPTDPRQPVAIGTEQKLEDGDEDWAQDVPRGDTELHQACKAGDQKLVLAMLKENSSATQAALKTKGTDGMTPIMYSAMDGNMKVFSKLHEAMDKEDLNIQANNGMSILHMATKHGNAAVVKRILKDAPTDFVDMQDGKGRTALYYALKKKSEDLMKDLIKGMSKDGFASQTFEGWSCLHVAVTRGLLKVSKRLIDQMDPEDLKLQTQQGSTVLHLAVSKDKLKIAELLLAKMDDEGLAIQNGKGSTALHLAVFKARLKILPKLLAQMSPDCIGSQRADGNTALHMAARKGRTDMLKMFVKAMGPKCLEQTTLDDGTALHCAAQNGHDECVQFIVKSCDDHVLAMQNNQGFTALAMAAEADRLDTVRTLLEASGGARSSPRDAEKSEPTDKERAMRAQTLTGKSPLHFAAINGNLKMVELLAKALGNDALAIKDSFGWNALHSSCAAGHLDLVEKMLDRMPKDHLLEPEKDGRTILHLASQYGHLDVVKVLLGTLPKSGHTIKSKNGSTLVHLCAHNGHLSLIKVLVESLAPAVFLIPDKYNLTAAQRAAQRGFENIAKLLTDVVAEAEDLDIDADDWKAYLPENQAEDRVWLAQTFGVELKSPTGMVSTDDVAKECDAVGMLFSTASKFGDGEEFNPNLKEAYTALREAGKKFQLIFISSDKDEGAFNNYYSTMPWLALPYPDRAMQIRLALQYKLNGFRSAVVVVDPKTGETLNKYGREAIMTDPDGEDFPWRRKEQEFWDLFQGELYYAGQTDPLECSELKVPNKYLGIYFTDNESVQSREFTRTLTKFYLDCGQNETDYTFDVVLAPCMETEQAFRETLGEIPFLTLPLGSQVCEELKLLFEIYEEDRLVILEAATGRLITANGRDGVELDPTRTRFPWPKAAVNFMTQDTFSAVSATPCCVILADGDDVDQGRFHRIFEALHACGEEIARRTPKNARFGELEFLVDNGDSGHTRFLRNIMDLKKKRDFVVIIDTFRMKVFPCRAIKKLKDIKRAAIKDFIAKFRAGTLESYPLRI